jgi:hypothetical protein
MPRLTRLRFVSIGYKSARMPDVTLDFSDASRKPIDTMLWLRNGGGKSSILNLFYSLLLPHKRSFLGQHADQGDRSLEEYVLPDDRALVLAEWQLDDSKRLVLTGGFYEWQQGEYRHLKRLFFMARVFEPFISLENIKLSDESGQRFTMYAFKQYWSNLSKQFPEAEPQETDQQQEWRKMLDGYNIDPDLFAYQVRMNSREGGADELFRFKEDDQFIDFFLELILRQKHSDDLAKNLIQFRDKLRQRSLQLLPSLEVIAALQQIVTTMLPIGQQRLVNKQLLGELQVRLEQIRSYSHQQADQLFQQLEHVNQLLHESEMELKALQKNMYQQSQQHIALARFALQKRESSLEKLVGVTREQLLHANQRRLRLMACGTFAPVYLLEAQIQQLENSIAIEVEGIKPELEQVQVAAYDLAAALLARAENLQTQAIQKKQETNLLYQQAQQARGSATQAHIESGMTTERLRQLEEKISAALASRAKLEQSGGLGVGQTLEDALQVWRDQDLSTEYQIESLKGQQIANQEQQEAITEQLHRITKDVLATQSDLVQLQVALTQAQTEQSLLENHSFLQRLFDQPIELHPPMLGTLRQHRIEQEQQLMGLLAQIAKNERDLTHLKNTGLLPPLQEVENIQQLLLEKNIRAWTGWEYIAENKTLDEIQALIQTNPEVVQGVLVREKELPRAKDILEQAKPILGLPIVVATMQKSTFFEAQKPNRFVLPPSSHAFFDKTVAHTEMIQIEQRLLGEHQQENTLRIEMQQLSDLTEQLERFFRKYEHNWFEQQETRIHVAATRENQLQIEQLDLESKRAYGLIEKQQLESKIAALTQQRQVNQKHLQQVNSHIEKYGDSTAESEKKERLTQLRSQIEQLSSAAQQQEIQAVQLEELVRKQKIETRELEERVLKDTQDARSINYLQADSLMVAKAANIALLRETHRHLIDLIEEKTKGHQLQTRLEQTKQKREERYGEFLTQLGNNVSEVEVRDFYISLSDKENLNTQLNQAIELENQVSSQLELQKAELAKTQLELKQHQKEYSTMDLTIISAEEKLLSETYLQELIVEKKQLCEELDRLITQTKQKQNHQTEQKNKLTQQHNQIQQIEKTVLTLLEQNEEVFQEAILPNTPKVWIELPREQLEPFVTDLTEQLKQLKTKNGQLVKQRDTIHQDYQNRLLDNTFEFMKPLKTWKETDLETDTQRLLTDLETRAKVIEQDIEAIDTHRNALITSFLGAANLGIQALQGLNNHSKLPEGAGTLAAQRFLKISLSTISTPTEQRERIGILLDDIVRDTSKDIPKGIEIIQRSVRKLTHPIKVEILHLDTDAPPVYIPVRQMSKESGGERLTSAVLLYCALARQRAKQIGANLKISSTLLLDNPVGSSSRVKYLNLQRQMASAMNIQLIYATGVQDHEAIRTMPNILRLRNEKRNAQNHQLIEVIRFARENDDLGGET